MRTKISVTYSYSIFLSHGLCGTLSAYQSDSELLRLRWQFVCDDVSFLTEEDTRFVLVGTDFNVT